MSEYRIQGTTGEWEVVVGLEVHAQVTSASKLFSGAADRLRRRAQHAGVAGRRRRCPACCRCPTPSASGRRSARDWRSIARSTAGAGSTARTTSTPTCRQGYQISQLLSPTCGRRLSRRSRWTTPRARSRSASSASMSSRTRASCSTTQHPTRSMVDLNRSGVALMEIVSRPDLRSPAQAAAYLGTLRSILRFVGSCDGDMEKGRCAPT